MGKSVAIIGTRGYPSYYGGFETAVRRLAPYLVDKGWDVTVYGRPETTSDGDPDRDHRVRTVVTSGVESKSLSTLSYGLTACLHAAGQRTDVALVMNCANGYWLPILRTARIPSLVNVDGIEWDRAKWGRLAKFIFHTGARFTARFGDELVYDAKAIGARWQDEFRRDGTFLPYGGDVPPELPVEPGLTHRGYVLLVARVVPENSLLPFIEAADRLAEHTDVVIVGSSGYGGPIDDAVKELSNSNPRVHWFGHVNDDQRLLALWQHAGVYFHGHSVGGTNPALVQAMACGAPIVARDTAYNREVLATSGVFVQPDSDSIYEGVMTLLRDSERQAAMSAATQARAIEHYSWDGVCAGYEQALYKLVADREANRSRVRIAASRLVRS